MMKTLSAIRNSARTPNPEPRALNEAERYLVGGVNSPVRAFRQIGCEPLMLGKGRGGLIRAGGGCPSIGAPQPPMKSM